MKRFEYDITKHTAEDLGRIVYFCSDSGECSADDVTDQEVDALKRIFNERGGQGWELIRLTTGKEGLMAFWKRGIE